MDPISLLVAAVATVISSAGAAEALRRFVHAILSREERAGRSLPQIVRDAIKGSPESVAAEPSLEERIQSLSSVMANSATLLEQITAEIELRAAFAKEKKEEADLAIAAASMNQEQLKALQRVVQNEVSSEGNRGIRAGLLIGLFSFIFGAAGTVLVTLFVHPLHG